MELKRGQVYDHKDGNWGSFRIGRRKGELAGIPLVKNGFYFSLGLVELWVKENKLKLRIRDTIKVMGRIK